MITATTERLTTTPLGRGRILVEARALFTTHGYAAVSMQQIADAAGVNKATLYHHFRDKEDLFVAVMRDEFAAVQTGIAAALAGGGTLRDQLLRVALHVFASHHSDLARLAADLRERVSHQRLGEVLCSAAPWDALRPTLERAAAAGELRAVDPTLVAQLFFSMLHSQLGWARLDPARPSPGAATAAMIVDVLLDGIAADDRRPPSRPPLPSAP